jgi:hypothetical protein
VRFPSIATLVEHAASVLRRFPWTLAAAAVAAAAGIVASTSGADDRWARLAFVAALGLPLTLSLSLLGEARHWAPGRRSLALACGVGALVVFFLVWPGIDQSYEAIRYFLLSAALHLTVAFLPFLGAADSLAFWQYNRRLFLGFLRAVVFSAVLFVGVAIALGALDKLFGVHVPGETYFRIWLIVALVVNTWIFLAAVPLDLAALGRDTEYPRGLKVFAQYVLTPLAFTYLVILLAYLIKIVAGGEWPSGWIGWLVASVSVTGLLGFLLVHPLRADPDEGWIRIYARWLFVGLIPAALMLLVAFWKRIVPYGLTEPRVLGLVLGVWLLGIALRFTARGGASIRIIPVSLAVLLLLTLYGPLSLTGVSVASQSRRLARLLRTADSAGAAGAAREASAALRFLIDHRAGAAIAARIGRPLPPIDWNTVPRHGGARDSLGARILALRGVEYVPEYARGAGGWFQLSSNDALPVAGFDWVLPATMGDTATRVAGADSVAVVSRAGSALVRVRVGADTLKFDLRPLLRRDGRSLPGTGHVTGASLRLEAVAGPRRAVLSLDQLSGMRSADSVQVMSWTGWVLLGRR